MRGSKEAQVCQISREARYYLNTELTIAPGGTGATRAPGAAANNNSAHSTRNTGISGLRYLHTWA